MASYEDLLEQMDANNQQGGGVESARGIITASMLESLAAARRQEQLVTAPREDAYGNVISYDPIKGWTVKKTPTTSAILEAQQFEELRGLTEDAPRNRAASKRASARSELADDAFTREFNAYQYRPRRSEQDYIGEAQRSLTEDRRQGLDQAGALMSRQALRGGNGTAADFASAFRKVQEGAFDGISNQARRQGAQDFITFEGGKAGMGQRDLELLAGLSAQDGRVPVQMSNIGQDLTSTQTQALHALIQALSQADQTRAGQASDLAAILAQGG